jgi:Ca-activated chloride channel family protein
MNTGTIVREMMLGSMRKGWRRGRSAAGSVLHGALACLAAATAAPAVLAQAPAAAPAGPPEGATAPALMVVMDASGSMWGRLGEERGSKLVITRDALRAALGRHGARLSVGLVTFPHRRRTDCGSAEVVAEPEPLDLDEFMEPLDRLNPRGRGPVVRGLQEAAKALEKRSGSAAIVLVQDNADNCGLDACAEMQALHKANPRLTAHVLGLGLEEKEVSSASCVAVVTGGRFVNVETAAEVTAALDDMVRRAALAAPTPAAASAGRAAPEAKTGAEAPSAEATPGPLPSGKADGPPGVLLYASALAGAPPIEALVEWRVRPAEGPPRVIAGGIGPVLELSLAPGAYTVTAEAGLVSRRHRFVVAAAGRKAENVTLEAGVISWAPAAGRAPDGSVAVLGLVRAATDLGQPSATGANGIEAWPSLLALPAEGRFVLPAGTWNLTIGHGRARRSGVVTLKAGDVVALDLGARAGTLSVEPSGPAGRPLEGALLIVEEDDPDAPRGRREIARAAGALERAVLPPGTYYVTAQRGELEARARVTVATGAETRHVLPVETGEIALAVRLAGKSPPADANLRLEIERLDDPSAPSRVLEPETAALPLPAGRYRVTGRLGTANATARTEISVVEGKRQSVQVALRAGRARLTVKDGGAGAGVSGDMFWEVFDAKGAPVWVGVARAPALWLAAGDYTIRALARGRRGEQRVAIADGADVTIEVEVQ